MSTDLLIQRLSREPLKAHAIPFWLRLVGSVLLGGLLSFFMMQLALGIQADLLQLMTRPEFWLKFTFALTLCLVGAVITVKAAKPGKTNSKYVLWVGSPVIAIWLIAVWSALQPSAHSIPELLEGSTWRVCSLLIASLSIPIFIAMFWSLQSMAPTRPRFSGFMAGLFSGGLAACIYCLHCPELSPVFVGIWYLLGILISAAVGALLGKSCLKW